MAKINLNDLDMGLSAPPKIDPLHDAQTLLNHSFGKDSGEYREIPLGQITVNPENDYAAEDTAEDIRELALDIERNGLLHNIVVSDKTQENGTYMILSGERRYRAYVWLYENRQDNRYAMILSKILSGLDPQDEMLVLDAANLQTRGGMSEERRFRKATVRFIENLRRKGGVSEEDAKQLAVRYTGVSEKLFEKNLVVEKHLHPAILALLDRDLIPKNQAVQYARMSEDMQKQLAENLQSAYESGAAALRDANDRLAVAAKTISALQTKLDTQEKSMREIDGEIVDAQISLSALNAMVEAGDNTEELAQQIMVVKKTLLSLEDQKRMYASTISSAKASLKKSEERLAAIVPEKKTGSALRDDVAAMVNKSMKKAESGVSGIASRTSVNRMLKMDDAGRTVMLERLTALQQMLQETVNALKNAQCDVRSDIR